MNKDRLRGTKIGPEEVEYAIPQGWGDYMVNKQRKLQQQYVQECVPNQYKQIFSGCVIYVNGYTDPSTTRIKELVVERGGIYTLYHGSAVTHVVCENLPHAKVILLNAKDKIVNPRWITDSVREDKLMPIDDYIVVAAGVDTGQRTLFQMNAAPVKEKSWRDEFFEPRTSAPIDRSSDNLSTRSAKLEEGMEINAAVSRAQSNIRLGDGPSATNDPEGFVAHYYEKSRLHHLSTWKAKLQQDLQNFVREKLQRKEASGSPQENPSGSTPQNSNQSIGVKTTNRMNVVNTDKLRDERFLYIDMDCFFAAVAVAKRPHLKGKPVVVCHSAIDHTGHADIASASYEAREFGIKNGSWLAEAKKLCPTLEVVPYDFEEYETVSRAMYRCLLQHSNRIEARSCDEAICAIQGNDEIAVEIAKNLRENILKETQCSASVGIGSNISLAKIACRFAKPLKNGEPGPGVYVIKANEAASAVAPLSLRSLQGVGRKFSRKLNRFVYQWLKLNKPELLPVDLKEPENDDSLDLTCGHLAVLPLTSLQKEFGNARGEMFFNSAKGIDDTELKLNIEPKSIGAEVNFGIRFTTFEHSSAFIKAIANEVERRLRAADMQGQQITLKLMQALPHAGVAVKFMGHGRAENKSKSMRLVEPTCSAETIWAEAVQLYKQLKCPPDQLRGLGIQMTVLSRGSDRVCQQSSLKTMFAHQKRVEQTTKSTPQRNDQKPSISPTNNKKSSISSTNNKKSSISPTNNKKSSISPTNNKKSSISPTKVESKMDDDVLPSQSQIDPTVWDALPLAVRREFELIYESKNLARKLQNEAETDVPPKKMEIDPATTVDNRSKKLSKPTKTTEKPNTNSVSTTSKLSKNVPRDDSSPDPLLIALAPTLQWKEFDSLLIRQLNADMRAGELARNKSKSRNNTTLFPDSYLRQLDWTSAVELPSFILAEQLRQLRSQAQLDIKMASKSAKKSVKRGAVDNNAQTTSTKRRRVNATPSTSSDAAVHTSPMPNTPVQRTLTLFATFPNTRQGIRDWLAKQEEPQEQTAVLRRVLMRLINGHELDNAHLILYEIRRLAAQTESAVWQQTFDTLLVDVQNRLHEKSGGLIAMAPFSLQ